MRNAGILFVIAAISGCTTTPIDSTASSPGGTFARLLVAMQDGSPVSVSELTTSGGMKSLMVGVGEEDPAVVFKRWGGGWSNWDVRWQRRDAHSALAYIGPDSKEHSIEFVLTEAGWKLSKWTPGE